jgi:cobalamin biosynthesis protein CobT
MLRSILRSRALLKSSCVQSSIFRRAASSAAGKGTVVTTSASNVAVPANTSLKQLRKELSTVLAEDLNDLTVSPDEGLNEYIAKQRLKIDLDPVTREVQITRVIDNYNIVLKFDPEIDEDNQAGENEEQDQYNEEEGQQEEQEEKEEQEEEEDAGKMPQHSFVIDIHNTAKSVDAKHNFMHISAYTDRDGQFCIESLSFDPELAPDNTPKVQAEQNAFDALLDSNIRSKEFDNSLLYFDDLSDQSQDKLLEFFESLGIDDRLAQFIQHYAQIVRTQGFLTKLNQLKGFISQ